MRLVLLAALWLCACAPRSGEAVKPGSGRGAAGDANAMALQAAELQAQAKAAQELAEKQCEPFRNREVSWDEERTIGAELAVTYTAQLGHLYLDGVVEKDPQKLLNDLSERKSVSLPPGGKNAVSTHVAIVGRNLARFSGRPALPWVFGVIQSDTAQSFSTPGGFVFVTTGLLKKMTNEAQLGGVLAHEIAHVVQKDVLKKYAEAKHRQCIAANYAASFMEKSGAQNAATAEAAKYARKFSGELQLDKEDSAFMKFLMQAMLMQLSFGHDKEAEFLTDKLALELVSFAGYDAVQYEQFLTTWAQEKHPASNERAARLEALRNGELKDFVHGTAKPELGKVFAPLSAP